MDRVALEEKLEQLPPKMRCWFALRFALRTLPNLVQYGNGFAYWGTDSDKHLCAVFRALTRSIFSLSQQGDIGNEAAIAARVAARSAARASRERGIGARPAAAAARSADAAAAAATSDPVAIAAGVARSDALDETSIASRPAAVASGAAIRHANRVDLARVGITGNIGSATLWLADAVS